MRLHRLLFIGLIGEMAVRFEIDVYAWVLMGNHYHLLLKTNRANLSKSMQWFGANYTCKKICLQLRVISKNLIDGIESTRLKTTHAFDAFVIINDRHFFFLPGNSLNRTGFKTKAAFFT